MRGFGILLFAGMVFLAGAAYWAMSGTPATSLGRVFDSVGGRDLPTKTLPPVAPLDVLDEIHQKQAKVEKRRAAAAKAPAPAPDPPAPVEVAPPPPPPPPAKFPAAQDIPAGTPRDSLQQSFGAPYLKATSLQGNGVIETWVYLQHQRNLATFAQMQNGRVISSATTTY
jgi:hypothetical protein